MSDPGHDVRDRLRDIALKAKWLKPSDTLEGQALALIDDAQRRCWEIEQQRHAAAVQVEQLDGQIAEMRRHLESTWRWRYLAEARLSVLKMALANDRVRRGLPGKAWDGALVSEMLEAVTDDTAEPCMDCGGTGTITDFETGPGMCPCCHGVGVLKDEERNSP